jgi:hypothetical protein
MECQAEAAALLPSFRELTSAGVVGRDRNGSPSDGSTDGSQQSQVPSYWKYLFDLHTRYLGWCDCRFSNQYYTAGRFFTTVAMEIAWFTFISRSCYCSCRRRRNRRPNSAKNFVCLRHTPWFSYRSRFSHIRHLSWNENKDLMEVCLNFPQKRESIQSSADETLSAHESTTNCLQSNDPDDQDHLMLIQLQQDSPHGSY